MRGGVGVGPFSVSGGSRGGNGGDETAEGFLYLILLCVAALAYILTFVFFFLILPILSAIALAVIVTFRRDFDALSDREAQLWSNRNGLLVCNLVPITGAIIAFIIWWDSRTGLSECTGTKECSALQIAHDEHSSSLSIYSAIVVLLIFAAIPLTFSRVRRPEIWTTPSLSVSHTTKEIWFRACDLPRRARFKFYLLVRQIKKSIDD